MVYKVVSIVCDKIDKGFSMGYVELQFLANTWEYDNFIKAVYDYPDEWKQKLNGFATLSMADYINRHDQFGQYLGGIIKNFIEVNKLEFKVQLIALKGFNFFATNELGNPAQVAAITGINVVADLAGINIALGGNGNYQHSVASFLFADAALQTALLAVLRWREENSFLAEHTGAKRNCIGGGVWLGLEA